MLLALVFASIPCAQGSSGLLASPVVVAPSFHEFTRHRRRCEERRRSEKEERFEINPDK